MEEEQKKKQNNLFNGLRNIAFWCTNCKTDITSILIEIKNMIKGCFFFKLTFSLFNLKIANGDTGVLKKTHV